MTSVSPITAARWLTLTLGTLCLLILLSVGIAWRMDVFGIFRDPHGRALVTSDHERKAKFLLNQAYVPANFDALIIGASASVNWRPESLTGYRFYNESLEGGDASEQRKLVEQALHDGHFRVAIVCLHPRITALHVLQDGFDTASRAEALGSISAYSVEYEILRDRLLHRTSAFTPDGSHAYPPHAPPPYNARWPYAIYAYQDPLAVEDYRALVQELLDHGIRVVYVVNPVFEDALTQNRTVMDDYLKQARATMPTAPLIDFNAAEYTAFRSNQNNFMDAVHLSPAGAATLSHLLNERLQTILTEKQP